jgi:chromate reductase
MKILALAASNSRNSINKQLIAHAARLLEGGLISEAEVEVIDINDYEMPLYGLDLQGEIGIPDLAKQFFTKIGAADALLISFAEHNGSQTVAYKNLYDWASRIDAKVYQGKPAVFLATSPGPRGGAGALASAVTTAPFFGCELRGHLSVPSFYDNFDPEAGIITNADLQSEFESTLTALGQVES